MPKTDESLATISTIREREKNIAIGKMSDGCSLDRVNDRAIQDGNSYLEAQNLHLIQQERALIIKLNKKREDLNRLEEHKRITEKSIEEIIRLLNETRRKIFEQNNLEVNSIELGKRKAQRVYTDPLIPVVADARCSSFSAPPSFPPPEKMSKIEPQAINLSTTDREVKVQEAIDFAEQRRHSQSEMFPPTPLPPQRLLQPTAILQPRLPGQQTEFNGRMLHEVNLIRQHWQRLPSRVMPPQRPTSQTFSMPTNLPYSSSNHSIASSTSVTGSGITGLVSGSAAGTTTPSLSGSSTVSASTAGSKARCEFCKASANFLCSGCHQVWYCSKPCQVK